MKKRINKLKDGNYEIQDSKNRYYMFYDRSFGSVNISLLDLKNNMIIKAKETLIQYTKGKETIKANKGDELILVDPTQEFKLSMPREVVIVKNKTTRCQMPFSIKVIDIEI